jgi:hypothetical protein
MAKTKKLDWVWEARLDLLRLAAAPLIPLDVIGTEMRRSIKRIETEGSTDQDLVDLECENIEELLELAFIACQLTITRVESCCRVFYESIHARIKWEKYKKQLMLRRDTTVRGTPHTRIAAIDAFANYAKHQDEWGHDWSKVNRKSRLTSEIVKRLGATPGSSGNMRSGFKIIVGHNHFERVDELSDIIRAWGKGLATDYERDLNAQRPERASAKR